VTEALAVMVPVARPAVMVPATATVAMAGTAPSVVLAAPPGQQAPALVPLAPRVPLD
jgi:hypothetical protein